MAYETLRPIRALPALGPTRWCYAAQIARALATALIAAALLFLAFGRARAEEPGFEHFIEKLWPDAQKAGVSRPLFERAFAGMTPDESVLEKTRKQAEFVKPIGDYLATAVSANRIAKGRDKRGEWDDTLAKIEHRFGVDRHIVLGVWGMETNFGGFTGDRSVIRSLATLASAHYRGDYFRKELVKALQILQQGHVPLQALTGSWAGAMGQTQFMPSSFQAYAVDFDGDGRKDIWTTIPDALASTANYLARHGWQKGMRWGWEVLVPEGGAAAHQTGGGLRAISAFSREGYRRADGQPLPQQNFLGAS
jgi:lytic murein transglycosylase